MALTASAPRTAPPSRETGPQRSPGAADWRFLVPLAGRVLDLTGREDVAEAVAAEAVDAVSLPAGSHATALGTARPFDTVLVHDAWESLLADPAREALPFARDLARLVAPAGSLWIAGRGRAFGAAAWQRVLARAGFTVRRAFALRPDADDPAEILPLELEIARIVAAQVPGVPAGSVARAVGRGARRVGLADRFVPAFGLAALRARVAP